MVPLDVWSLILRLQMAISKKSAMFTRADRDICEKCSFNSRGFVSEVAERLICRLLIDFWSKRRRNAVFWSFLSKTLANWRIFKNFHAKKEEFTCEKKENEQPMYLRLIQVAPQQQISTTQFSASVIRGFEKFAKPSIRPKAMRPPFRSNSAVPFHPNRTPCSEAL